MDIAKESGVSKATVSRVLNHGDLVDAETRNRVLAVMKKYRYSPSLVARSLSSQESNTIGIVIPEVDNAFYGKILRTVVNIAGEEGLIPICFDTGNSAEKDVKALRLLRDQRASGVIYAPSVDYGEPDAEQMARQALDDLGVPVVLIDRDVPSFGRSGVFFDNSDASYRATKLLIAAGHAKIGVINGNRALGLARERLDGYMRAYAESGLAADARHVFEGDFTAETAYSQSMGMLEMADRPSAALTCNNDISLGFLRALAEKKMKTPKDIEHIGIDEIDTFDYLHMRYNHITRSRTEMAEKAMGLLLSQIREPGNELESVRIPARFVLDSRLRRAAAKHRIMI
jgi:LacI family transcriptional regulator